MNPANAPRAANGPQPSSGFSIDDAVFTLFRHKWLILSFVTLGVAGAIAVRFVRPPLFVSTAKVMVHYVNNDRELMPTSPDAPRAHSLDMNAMSILSGQIELITSLDVAKRVAEAIGPARILAKRGGGNDLMVAAGVVRSGIEVEPPKTQILTITFKHRDPDIVQPVLEEVLKAYTLQHKNVYLMPNEFLVKQQEELRGKLSDTEKQLKDLKMKANILFPEELKQSYRTQISKVQGDLLDVQRELLERGERPDAPAQTNALVSAAPADELSRYNFWTTRLEELKLKENDLLLTYKEAHPVVQNVREQIQKLARQRADLEQKYPSLTHLQLATARTGTNTEPTQVLVAREQALSTILSNLQAQATQVLDLEPKVAELDRQKAELQKTYESVMKQLEQQQTKEALSAGQVINMSDVQRPTPPGEDHKKMMKLIGMVLAGCIGMGLGLAFLIDLFLDRSIKRSSDIERHLHLPVFLSIPDTAGGGWLRLPRWLSFFGHSNGSAPNGNGSGASTMALAPWDPANQLLNYTEGLRERVMSYFEVNNLNLKKPKLVAVTGCANGAGVSTLASGLAAALSKTGDGNVLLVDMNVDQGAAQSFYKGKPGCGITAALEPENRSGAQVEENLYLATMNNGGDTRLPKLLPTRLNHLMPQLKASDYDYIIFDMPPVTQTSATPRLASYMDLALLVLESEKTSQHAAARASSLMREARANVAAVLNKHRSHAPAGLSHEA